MSKYEEPHPRSIADQKRAEYTEDDRPQNGNNRGRRSDRNGALGNDLVNGRQGQDTNKW